MEYCCHVWGAAAKTTLDLLDRIQNRAIRLINNPEITDKLDSLKHRRDVADLTIFYKYSYDHCSKEVSEIMPSRENVYVKQGLELPPTVKLSNFSSSNFKYGANFEVPKRFIYSYSKEMERVTSACVPKPIQYPIL